MNNPFEIIDARLKNIECLLLDIKYPKKEKQQEAEEFLTIQQAAVLLNLAVPTLYSKVCKGELPVMKRNKRLYFLKKELIEFIKTGRKKTTSEIESEAINSLSKRGKEKI
jgi:excisionase family DNA binding protein